MVILLLWLFYYYGYFTIMVIHNNLVKPRLTKRNFFQPNLTLTNITKSPYPAKGIHRIHSLAVHLLCQMSNLKVAKLSKLNFQLPKCGRTFLNDFHLKTKISTFRDRLHVVDLLIGVTYELELRNASESPTLPASLFCKNTNTIILSGITCRRNEHFQLVCK
jgi:hypothetical protein